jgi:hypothetical protein
MNKPGEVDGRTTVTEESLFEPGGHIYWMRYNRMLNGKLLLSREEESILARDPDNYEDFLELVERFVSVKAPGAAGKWSPERLERILDDPDNAEEFLRIIRAFVMEWKIECHAAERQKGHE